MRVNLRFYDWIIINTSAGKDSQTMMEEVVNQAPTITENARD